MNKKQCRCEILPIDYKNYTSRLIEIDKNFGEVKIKKCVHCSQIWLQYFIEYEHMTKSGRWYLGKIEEEDIQKISARNSVKKLEGMEWYFFGGSYFGTIEKRGKGRLILS